MPKAISAEDGALFPMSSSVFDNVLSIAGKQDKEAALSSTALSKAANGAREMSHYHHGGPIVRQH